MKFLFDSNISIYHAHGLRELRRNTDDEIFHLRDRFPETISDTDFISTLIQEGGWSIISADRFRKNSAERLAVQNPRISVFVMSRGFVKSKAWPRAKILVNQWEAITAIAAVTQGGVYEVRAQGKIAPYSA